MDFEKGKISGQQLMLLVMGFVMGSVLLLSFPPSIVKNNTWLVLLAGVAVTGPFIITYALLAKRFPGMGLVQINEVTYGPYLGKIISIYYIIFFLFTLSFNLRDLGGLYNTFIMPEAPFEFFIITGLLVSSFAVWNGPEVLARISLFLIAISLFVLTVTFSLLLGKMNFSNFLPVLDIPLIDFLHGTNIMAAIPFGEAVIFLTLMSAVNDNKQMVNKTILGFFIGAMVLLVASVRNTAVLGSVEPILASTSYQSARLIDIGNVITRMDILVAIGQTSILFLKISILFLGTVVSMSRLFGLKSYHPLILPVGGIAAVIAFTVYKSPVEQATVSLNAGIIYNLPLIFIFPPLSLLIARVFNMPKKGNEIKK